MFSCLLGSSRKLKSLGLLVNEHRLNLGLSPLHLVDITRPCNATACFHALGTDGVENQPMAENKDFFVFFCSFKQLWHMANEMLFSLLSSII